MFHPLAELRWELDWWPERTVSDVRWIGWVLVGLGAVLAARMGVGYWRWVVARTRPLRLFMRVASAGGLTPRECWQLYRLARSQRLSSPLTLLMSGATLEHHLAAAASKMPAYRAAAFRRSFEGVQKRFAAQPERG